MELWFYHLTIIFIRDMNPVSNYVDQTLK